MRGNLFGLFGREVWELAAFFKRHRIEIAVISLATLFIAAHRYHQIGPVWFSAVVYFVILPVLVIIIVLRSNPLDFGLRAGNFRMWGFHVAVSFIVALPVLYISSFISDLASYYSIEDFNILKYSLETAVYLLAWEFLFRGFLLFGLKEKLGESSIIVQMIPFALLHFGKPEVEVISTILVGIYLGYVAYRGNSYWPAFIIHLFINVLFRVMVNVL